MCVGGESDRDLEAHAIDGDAGEGCKVRTRLGKGREGLGVAAE